MSATRSRSTRARRRSTSDLVPSTCWSIPPGSACERSIRGSSRTHNRSARLRQRHSPTLRRSRDEGHRVLPRRPCRCSAHACSRRLAGHHNLDERQAMSRRSFVPYGPAGAAVQALAHVTAADLAGTPVTPTSYCREAPPRRGWSPTTCRQRCGRHFWARRSWGRRSSGSPPTRRRAFTANASSSFGWTPPASGLNEPVPKSLSFPVGVRLTNEEDCLAVQGGMIATRGALWTTSAAARSESSSSEASTSPAGLGRSTARSERQELCARTDRASSHRLVRRTRPESITYYGGWRIVPGLV